MALIGFVPRRCVNLNGGSLFTILGCKFGGTVQEGPFVAQFEDKLAKMVGSPAVFTAATGRSVFQLALEALDLPKGSEIVFPEFTFPVMPMVAKLCGYEPVFCSVDPLTFNAGPEQIEQVLTDKTSAVLATHLFGRPAPIREIAELCEKRGITLMEDCAHALGVKVGGQYVGTFGQVGIYSFAEGKNMPCFGGGAIAVQDPVVAERARKIIDTAPIGDAKKISKKAMSIWAMWLATRPLVFGLTAYQVLRFKAWRGEPLMDSAVGNELLTKFEKSSPRLERFANLQGKIGLRQLDHIAAFNAGAQRNAEILTAELGDVPGIRVPELGDDNIYVYYPITVDPDKRDELRLHLLENGVDTKRSDMADCGRLDAFVDSRDARDPNREPHEASVLEVCVYPIISQRQMRRIARTIRTWAGLPATRS